MCAQHMPVVPTGPEEGSNPLELESQVVVSRHGGAGNENPGSREEQPLLLTTEPSFQSLSEHSCHFQKHTNLNCYGARLSLHGRRWLSSTASL